MIRVLLCDDQELVRAGFRLILDLEDDMEVVGEACDGRACLAEVARTAPDVVLMDIRMPVMDGDRGHASPRAPPPRSARVLVLTTFGLDDYVYEAVRAGASGFLLKDVPRDQLVAGIRVIARGETLLAPRLTRRLLERFVARRPRPPAYRS